MGTTDLPSIKEQSLGMTRMTHLSGMVTLHWQTEVVVPMFKISDKGICSRSH